MGNTHDSEIARIEADFIHNKWRTTDDYRWGYTNERGPETWWIYYPSASGGNQSPIDVITEEVWFDPDLWHRPLHICYGGSSTTASDGQHSNCGSGTDDSGDEHDDGGHGNGSGGGGNRDSMTMVNTGNTARINITNSSSYVTGGPCKDHSYVLEQIHLHWGEDDTSGSEHLINAHSFAAEIHLVHWNEDLYDCYEEAVKREDGVVILAVFVKLSEDRANRGLLSMSEALEDIEYREQSTSMPSSIEARSFLPDDTNHYWTYKGSFTTPPCYETVTWILFHESVPITSDILAKFRELHTYCENETRPVGEFDGLIGRNTRPLQPSGTRKVYTSEDRDGRDPHTVGAAEGHHEDPFRTSTAARHSTFPDGGTGSVIVRQCGRA